MRAGGFWRIGGRFGLDWMGGEGLVRKGLVAILVAAVGNRWDWRGRFFQAGQQVIDLVGFKADFDPAIRWFESSHPSHIFCV